MSASPYDTKNLIGALRKLATKPAGTCTTIDSGFPAQHTKSSFGPKPAGLATAGFSNYSEIITAIPRSKPYMSGFAPVSTSTPGAFSSPHYSTQYQVEYLLKKPAPYPCQVVRVLGTKDRVTSIPTESHFFEVGTAIPNHPIFISGESIVSPISRKINIPLIIYREPITSLTDPLFIPSSSNPKNETASRLLMDLQTGADYPVLGTTMVARFDYRPLSIGLLTTIHAYVDMLKSERYGKGNDGLVEGTITPRDFAEFARNFIDSAKICFNNNWDENGIF